jgi:hypothetical protein
VHDADQGLARGQRADHFLADRLFLDAAMKSLTTGSATSASSSARRTSRSASADIGFGQARFTAQGLHDAGKALGQVVEHLDSRLV